MWNVLGQIFRKIAAARNEAFLWIITTCTNLTCTKLRVPKDEWVLVSCGSSVNKMCLIFELLCELTRDLVQSKGIFQDTWSPACKLLSARHYRGDIYFLYAQMSKLPSHKDYWYSVPWTLPIPDHSYTIPSYMDWLRFSGGDSLHHWFLPVNVQLGTISCK